MQNEKSKEVLKRILINIAIPVLLLLYPLIKADIGVDYMDSMYSPGNFVFFPEMEGTWVIATYLANAIGFLLTNLPGGATYLGLRIYTGLLVSVTALISYFWFKDRIKLPAWVVAVGEFIAIGFCWCPTTILYNYLTYLFMTVSVICLYEGLVSERKGLLILSGVFLGANLMVRFPNVIEVGFILAVWFYAFIKRKSFNCVLRETLWCMLGYFGTVLAIMAIIIACYGVNSYVDMIASLFSMTDSASSYKPVEMVLAIIREYTKGLKWPAGMCLYVLMTAVMFAVEKKRFVWIKRILTVAGIPVLFRWYYGQGMFNVNYHTYPSMFQWATTLLIIAIVVLVITLIKGSLDKNESEAQISDRRLLCVILLLIIAITPIGSNNNIYPNMNNLFLVAPMAVYLLYELILKIKPLEISFPVRAMAAAVVMAVLIQSIGFGMVFVFRGARDGEERNARIENNEILKGMYTNQEKADAIEGLTKYWQENVNGEQRLLLFGHIPGVSYFLDTPCAIPHSWPDLASYAYETFETDMEVLKDEIRASSDAKPVIIVSYGVNAVITDDATAMDYYVNNMESGEEPLDRMQASKKLEYLKGFIADYEYTETYSNNRFVVYE